MRTLSAPLARARKHAVLPESLILAVLCTLDMISTLYLVRGRMAVEANPLMAPSLAHSDAAFLTLKGLSYMVPIVILELLRSTRGEFVRRALRVCVGGYVVLYIVGSVAVRFAH